MWPRAFYDTSKFDSESEFHQWMLSEVPLTITIAVTVAYVQLLLIRKESALKNYKWLQRPLKAALPVYNVLQAAFNSWHAYALWRLALEKGYPVWGNKEPAWNPTLGYLLWLYYLNKVVDCIDTVFIKLNAKKRITPLHAVHHVVQIWFVHWVLVIYPKGDNWFPTFLNSTVHAGMYSWYLCSASGVPFFIHVASWTKPCLTLLQMTQFVAIIVHNVNCYRFETTPRHLALTSLAWMIFLFVLFSNFWRNAYGRRSGPLNKETKPATSGLEIIKSGQVPSSSWSVQFLAFDSKVFDLMYYRSSQEMRQWLNLFERRGLVALGMGYAKEMWCLAPSHLDEGSINLDDALYSVSRQMYGNLRALKQRLPRTTALSWWWQGRRRGVKPGREVRDRAAEHYNLSSSVLWDSMLDQETKTYTCGIFSGKDLDLGRAQLRKVDYYIDEIMGLKYKTKTELEHYSVLDIGAGWGSVVNRLAKRYPQVSISGLTHSPEQIKEYHESVTVILADMIDHDYKEKAYDCILMIEVEHVGRNNYGRLFKKIRKALKDKGIYVMQSLNTATTYPFFMDEFIDRYIFPGGYLPSVKLLADAGEQAGLKLMYTCEWDKLHYEIAFELWRRRFAANYEAIASAIGQESARAFRIYLAFTQYTLEAGGFATHTVIFNKRGQGGIPSYFPRGVPPVPAPGISEDVLSQWLSSKRLKAL